jgi:hypothetical protein
VNGEDEAQSPEKGVWRASLEDPNTRERKAFAGLDELVDYLRERTGQVARGGAASDVDEVSKRKGGRP